MTDSYTLNKTPEGYPYYGPQQNAPQGQPEGRSPDPWAAFPDTPPAPKGSKPGDVTSGGDVWAAFPDKPPKQDESKPKREITAGQSALTAVREGASFGLAPVLEGASEAAQPDIDKLAKAHGIDPSKVHVAPHVRSALGAANMLANWMTGNKDPAVAEAYERGRKEALSRQEAGKEQHPIAYLGGQLAGALMTPMGAGGVTTAGRLAHGAITGGIGAGLYGAGEALSEDKPVGDVLKSAASGAATGAPFGAAGAGIAEALGRGAGKIASVVRGTRDTDTEAARRIVGSLRSDFEAHGPSVGQAEITAGNQAGTPRSIIDVGGERTRALARSSANTSPEARQSLTEMTGQRFEQQSPRVAGFIRNLTGGGHAANDTEALQQAARISNRPAYAKAYAAGDRQIWSPELERLASAPALNQAMIGAVQRGKNRAVNDKMGGFNPSAIVENGLLKFKKGSTGVPTYPNLQFWDYVQRELADMAKKADRLGAKEESGALKGLHRQLRDELDRMVPEFGLARSGAAAFFGAENALEAGTKFVMSNASIPEARRALSKMSAPERELFARGFASELADKLERVGDKRSVLNSIFIASPAARQKIEMALGPSRARQLEALLRIETVVDEARKALGNSTTARQLTEMGMAGGAVALFEGVKEQDFNPAHIITAALLYGGVKHGAKVVDEKVARRVGEMLASNDPSILAKGVKVVERSPVYFDALRRATGSVSRVAAHDIGGTNAIAGAGAALQSLIKKEQELGHHDLQDQMGQ